MSLLEQAKALYAQLKLERFFMEHSVKSVEQAFEVAREFLAGAP